MSSEKINQLFWLYYGQAIKNKAGANFGSEGVFFLATEAQKGPPAGDNIPDSYTYQGLHDLGNNLLAADNLFYNPSALHGYAEALDTYLNYVDLGQKPHPKLDTALLLALQAQDAGQIKYDRERTKALEQFTQDSKLGLIGDQKFAEYVASGSTPAFIAARTNLANYGSTVQDLQSQIAGPMAAKIQQDRAKLAKGSDINQDYPGFNMRCAVGNLLSPAELVNANNSGKTIPDPPFHRLPYYNAPNYKTSVQTAQRQVGSEYEPSGSLEFTIDTGKDTSSFNFGQNTAGGGASVSYGGWFSFDANASHSSKSETLETGSESTQVKVEITYDALELVPITPGDWNFDVSKYKLKEGAPKELKTLVRPSQLVLATRMGYKITVGADTATTIDKKLNETTSGGGGIRVFGLPISVNANASETTEKTSHVGTWDKASNTFSVKPTDDTGFATIVGIVGEKFKIL